jgi:two-component system phosphate regulon response regulator PhoB
MITFMNKQEASRSVSRNAPGSPPTGEQRGRKRILVVDDEKDILEIISYNVRRQGWTSLTASTGTEALEIANEEEIDLIVLDLMLPGIDGTEVARRLKAEPRTASIPIIMLTAKSEETDVIVGLTLGADDYVTKPFSPKILMARIHSILRRSEPQPAAEEAVTLKAGSLTIDTGKHEVTVNGEPVKVTLTEFKLLAALVNARGRVLSRDQLMDKALGTGVFVTDRAIDVHVTAIRRKLGQASWMVHTVRGVGYRLLEAPEESE